MKRLSSVVLFFALLQISLLIAAIPQQVNYQGFLSDSSGNPLNQTIALTATIYGDSLGVTSLWSEVHAGIVVTNGQFAVILGSATPIPATVFSGAIRWLGIRVNADPELRPLRPMLSTPSAFRSLLADSAGYAKSVADNSVTSAKITNGTIQLVDIGQNSATAGEVIKWNGTAWEASPDASSSGGWIDNGTLVGLVTATDSVSLNSTLRLGRLNVGGSMSLTGQSSIYFDTDSTFIKGFTGGDMRIQCEDLFVQTQQSTYFRDAEDVNWVEFDGLNQRLGVGTTAPEERLQVENAASGGRSFLQLETSHASNFGETGIRFKTPQNTWHLRMDDYTNNNIPAGSLSLRSQDGALEALTVLEDGKVGVGTTAPTRKLHVSGSVQIKDTLYAGAINPTLIAASRQPNEPGMAMNKLLNEVSLDHSNTEIVSETITVPDSGYVLAFAAATASMDHTWGDNDDYEVTISQSSVYLPPSNRARVKLPMNAGSGLYVFTLSPIAAFYVESAGEYTYRVYGHRNGPAATEVSQARLNLLYVPTFYGSIFWEKSSSQADLTSAVQESEKSQVPEMAADPDRLPTEMRKLVQNLVAEEVAKLKKEFEARVSAIEATAR